MGPTILATFLLYALLERKKRGSKELSLNLLHNFKFELSIISKKYPKRIKSEYTCTVTVDHEVWELGTDKKY